MKTEIKLNQSQKDLLKKFIVEFLPKRGTKRKNSGNEMEYIGFALDQVFKKYFGFRLNRKNIIEIFEELEYDIFTKYGVWDPDAKEMKPTNKNKGESISFRMQDIYNEFKAQYIYIDVEPLVVRSLMLSTRTMPKHTNEDKKIAVAEMKEKLLTFKKSSQ